ncbi:hypothetical protein DFH09DRAFT_1162071 [Mycena vulgaris]|nr:hypothetical protein DFH09DRAFT_1162071 [Mycena vulgaris]
MYNRDADGIYPPPGNARAGELDLPPLYSIHSHSSASSDYTRVDDGAYLPRPDLRRRADDDYESNPRRAKVQKKILVACNFCRGRKLRCDGLKPTCCNCIARQITCDYVDHPKRRGPGKAAKGPKPKKRAAKGEQRQSSEPFPSQKPFPTLDEFKFDMRTLAPELRPRGSFDSGVYSSSSHSGGGRHPSQQPSPEGSQGTPQQRRTSRSRKRGPSSEYSPPPESQPKR